MKQPIISEIRGWFFRANEFINHAIEFYFQNKSKTEKYADIDKVLKVEDDEKTAHVSSTYSKQPDFNYDNKVESVKHYNFKREYVNYESKEMRKFSFDLASSDLKMLDSLNPELNDKFQELHNQESMLFGQINRYLAIKSALYITALAIKENQYSPISYDTNLIKDLSFDYANQVKQLSIEARSVFDTNISIGLPRVVEYSATRRIRHNHIGQHLIEKSLNRYVMQYFGTLEG